LRLFIVSGYLLYCAFTVIFAALQVIVFNTTPLTALALWSVVTLFIVFVRPTDDLERGVESKSVDRNGEDKSKLLRDVLEYRSKADASADMLLAERLIVLNDIEDRVSRLRLRSTAILTCIGLALVGATLVVLFAGKLTSLDASAVSNLDRIKADLALEGSRLFKLKSLQQLTLQLQAPSMTQSQKDQLAREVQLLKPELTRDSGTPVTGFEPADVDQAISRQEKSIAELNGLISAAWKKELETEHGYNDWKYITATAISRIGVVLIIVFLVQILMGLYRYNSRLATYYVARRDLLTLWNGDPKDLKLLDQILAPPEIDFGREPRHPLQDLFRAAATKVNQTTERK
jgi:hypothetical protein